MVSHDYVMSKMSRARWRYSYEIVIYDRSAENRKFATSGDKLKHDRREIKGVRNILNQYYYVDDKYRPNTLLA
jgi:hypothetical protein